MTTATRIALAAGGLLLPTVASAQSIECFTASSSIEVPAPIDIAWDTLTDAQGYASWNPYIVQIFTLTGDPVDLTTVGSQFVIGALQPLSGQITFSPEIVTVVEPPEDGEALLAYAFDDPLAALIGFPERTQHLTAIGPWTTLYETEETFCADPFILSLIPTEDVQVGFDLQAEAFADEAQARFQVSGPPCTPNGNGRGSQGNNGICYR